MTERTPFTEENHSMVETVIKQTKDLMVEAGFNIVGSRFPFTYHHDYVREHVRGTISEGYSDLSRGDVADMLHTWAMADGPGPEAYIWTAIEGAVNYLKEYQPNNIVPKDLKDGIHENISKINYRFEDYTKDEIEKFKSTRGIKF